MHPQRRLEEPHAEEEEEEEELVSNCQPIGLCSSAVCGGESAKTGGVLHVTCSAPPGLHTGLCPNHLDLHDLGPGWPFA